MKWLRAAILVGASGAWALACSSDRPERGDAGAEPVGSTAQAITAACGFDTIGLPCDPDGPAGAKLECEGVCAIATTGLATCQGVAVGANDGIICGTTNGVGDAACKRYCSGKTCLNVNAPSGAACRPSAGSNPCEGQCNGAGACQALASPCDFGRIDQLCKFETCSFTNSSSCVTRNLRSNTSCSDADACSIGKCNGGVCISSGTVGCDDGNACTDDACDPDDGGCTGTPDNTNSCSDGNACTVGDSCNNGTCLAGGSAPDCDDSNECTIDTCDPNTGCANVQKSCSDGNLCTDDVCDPVTGGCSNPPKTCNDASACTTDTCEPAVGCVFTPLDCGDSDACTTDSCSGGVCEHTPVTCDDNDPCTTDSCNGGCQFAAIPGCGAGGAGAGGEPGDGGEPGSSGGVPNNGGAPGSAGAPDATGGTPDTAGAPGGAGAPSEAGTPGSAGTAQAGTAAGGTSAGGTGATAGVGATNSGGMGASGTGEGGEAASGAPAERTVQAGGCDCRTPARSGSPVQALLVALAAAVLSLRRRKAA